MDESSKNKKVIRSLLPVGVLTIVILIIIFAVLNFTGIFPLSKILPGFFTQPQVEKDLANDTEGTVPASPEQRINHYFVLGSMVSGYSVTVKDPSPVVEAIEDLNIYGRPYISTGKQTTGEMPLETVQIVLKEKDGVGETPYDKDVYIKLISRTILIDVTVSKEQLEDPDIQQQILEKSLRNIYRLIHKDIDDKEASQKVNDAIGQLPNNIFIIDKE